MHPSTERETLKAPTRIRRLLAAESTWQELLLVAFALDDQPNGAGEYDGEFPDFDQVHKQVSIICKGLLGIESDLKRYFNILTRLRDVQPQPGVRIRQIETCLACGADCLPRPTAGLCPDSCYPRWIEFRTARLGDRNVFIHQVKQETIKKLADEQAEDDQ